MRDALDRIYLARGPMGAGEVVELNESKIEHMKYKRGRRVDGQRVLSIICRSTGEMRIEIAPNRTAAPIYLESSEAHQW